MLRKLLKKISFSCNNRLKIAKSKVNLLLKLRTQIENEFLVKVLFEAFRNAALIKKYIKKSGESFDVVLAHELLASGYAGKRVSQICHSSISILDNVEYPILSERSGRALSVPAQDDPLADFLIARFFSGIAAQYDHVFATSEGQRNVLTELGVRDVELLFNAKYYHENAESTELRECCRCHENEKLVLYLNNVYPDAGAEDTIKALSCLPSHIIACFLGKIEPNLKETLNDLIKRLKLSDRVFFLPLVPPSQLISFISGADSIIIPLKMGPLNHYNCLPNRVFEAIMARKPIVAPFNSEIGSFVHENKIGTTFKTFEPEIIANAILESFKLVDGGTFSNVINEKAKVFSWEVHEKNIIKILNNKKTKNKNNCLIIACKKIERNDRIYRIVNTFKKEGYDVTVLAFSFPLPEVRSSGVKYINLLTNKTMK